MQPKAGRHLIKTSLTGWFDWLIYILIAKWQSCLEYTSSSSRTLQVVSLCLALCLESFAQTAFLSAFFPHPLPHHFLFRLRFSYRATVSLSLQTFFNHAYMNPIRTTNEKRIKQPRQQRRLPPKIQRSESTHSDKTGASDFVERLTILAVNRKSIVKRDAFRFSVRGIRDLGMSPIPLLFP